MSKMQNLSGVITRSKLGKRLRKKRHLGEFTEFGFNVSINLIPGLGESDFDKFVDDFIGVMEDNKLFFGGGGDSRNWSGFITSRRKYISSAEIHKDSVRIWLENNEVVSNCEVGDFVDAWNDVK